MKNEVTLEKRGITSFTLHCIAMATMLCDHLWKTILPNCNFLGYPGRIAFPLFAFMTVEGFVHTRDRKKYAKRMLMFALISEIPIDMARMQKVFDMSHQNVLWTFLIGIGLLCVYEKIKEYDNIIIRLPLYIIATAIAYKIAFLAIVDYKGYGVLMIAVFYFTRIDTAMDTQKKILLTVIQIAAMYWINWHMMTSNIFSISIFGTEMEIPMQGLALLALPLIWLYNGQQGMYNKVIKNVYYWFYPVHLFILGVIMMLL